jgi:hypothetical protein
MHGTSRGFRVAHPWGRSQASNFFRWVLRLPGLELCEAWERSRSNSRDRDGAGARCVCTIIVRSCKAERSCIKPLPSEGVHTRSALQRLERFGNLRNKCDCDVPLRFTSPVCRRSLRTVPCRWADPEMHCRKAVDRITVSPVGTIVGGVSLAATIAVSSVEID